MLYSTSPVGVCRGTGVDERGYGCETAPVLILTLFIVAFGFVLLASAYWMKVAETQKVRADLDARTLELATAYSDGYKAGVEQASVVMQNTVVSTVESISKVMTTELHGEAGKPVPQPEDVGANPAWYQWEDVTDNNPTDFGIGDSVFVERDAVDRVAAINDGESIIPGVPLPDMSGESFGS